MPLLIFIPSIIASFFYVKKIKKQKNSPTDLLTKREKMVVLGLTILGTPILAGAVFYYGFKKSLPNIAKQANKVSFNVFFIYIGLTILAVILG